MDTLEAPTAVAPAPTTPSTPAPAPEPKPQSADDRKVMAAWFDKSIGMSADEVVAADKKRQTNPNPLVPQQAAPAPVEPAAAPEPPKPPKPSKRKLAPAPAEPDDERITRVATEAAVRATESMRQREPEPKRESTPKIVVPDELQDDYRALQTLETMDKRHDGVADKWLKAVDDSNRDKEARMKKYISNWETQNPGREYNPDDPEQPEHGAYIEKLEAEPLPNLGFNERDVERARRQMIKNEAIAEAKSELGKEMDELRREVRGVKSKEQMATAAKDASDGVLKALEVEDISKTDKLVRSIYQDAASRAATFSQAAYALVNGLVREDEHNPLHIQVRQVTNDLVARLDVADPRKTLDADGRRYASPKVFAKMTAAQRAVHWTPGYDDLVEFAQDLIASDAKEAAQKRQEEFEELLKERGFEPKKPEARQVAQAQTQPKPVIVHPSIVNAPSLSSVAISTTPQNQPGNGNGNRGTGLYSRI